MYDFISDVLEYRNFKVEVSEATQNLLNIVDKSRTSSFSWKGQFSPQFVEFLLEEYTETSSILDPFCGSGTVIHESLLNKKSKICGIDINPAAIILAKFSEYSKFKLIERKEIFSATVTKIFNIINEQNLQIELLNVNCLQDFKDDHLAQCILLNAFKDKSEIKKEVLLKSIQYIEKMLLNLPYSPNSLLYIQEGDSRQLPFSKNEFDLIITSPPYINVFNYHHNYRKAIEALDKLPLIIAKSEIGANRKYRANRFKIVAQYCIDMALSLNEMNRVTRDNGDIVLIVGNLSTVKGQVFYNGEIIYLISKLLGSFSFQKKLERNFINRYGHIIKEEIIFLKNSHSLNYSFDEIISLGRDVANFVLNNALINVSDQHPTYVEIKEAIESIYEIMPGAFIKENQQ
ncbi:DNA methyltransferase [Acinetobacter baumannii]|uniref:DNA methyltransferase n=1 Tax=Acinetobacter baumannii TaxID=470 RepID=UPI0029C441DC|nr:DNA methyltransferase [Acinetobacter baumannii]MDX6036802.1 DNA methyltransferase [Acinetobacter baumannii]